MNIKLLAVVTCIALSLGGCSFTSTANFSKTGIYEYGFTDKSCEFNVFTTVPESKFQEIGLIEFSGNDMHGKMGGPETISELKELSAQSVCENGGNGILVWETNGMGFYKKATVIKTL